MHIEKLLKSGLINLAELSRRLWPHLESNVAANKLHNKVKGKKAGNGYQRITDRDREAIEQVFREFEG